MPTIYAPSPIRLPSSLWAATAEPTIEAPPLAKGGPAEVVIIGAGYTGLSTALHLAEKGREPVVLDAGEPGYGASGRNGGQVIPGLKHDPDWLLATFGERRGAAMAQFAGKVADRTFALIERHQIRCHARQSGWIQAATSPRTLDLLHRRAKQWVDLAGTKVQLLDRREIEGLTGAKGYLGGWIDPRGGSLQPLSYARGLAAAAQRAGARIHSKSLVTSLTQDGTRWRVSANGVDLVANTVVLATNGYTGNLWPGLRRTIMPATSIQIATEPLPARLRQSILSGGLLVSDSRRLLVYMRRDPEDRFVIGGRGSFAQREPQHFFDKLRAAALRTYPDLAGIRWEFQWGGTVALTIDGLPHIHRLAPGLLTALGYNGRGVAMATQMGTLLADLISGVPDTEISLPITQPRPIPFHGLRQPVMELTGALYRIMDRFG